MVMSVFLKNQKIKDSITGGAPPQNRTTSIASVRDICSHGPKVFPVPFWPVTLPIALLVAAGQGMPSTTLVNANVSNAVSLPIYWCLLGFGDVLVLCETHSASKISPGMNSHL